VALEAERLIRVEARLQLLTEKDGPDYDVFVKGVQGSGRPSFPSGWRTSLRSPMPMGVCGPAFMQPWTCAGSSEPGRRSPSRPQPPIRRGRSS
jgi:hypothetical protein